MRCPNNADMSKRKLSRQQAWRVEKIQEERAKRAAKRNAEAEEALAAARVEVEEAEALVSRVPDEVSGENALLQAEVIKLEGMVREPLEVRQIAFSQTPYPETLHPVRRAA